MNKRQFKKHIRKGFRKKYDYYLAMSCFYDRADGEYSVLLYETHNGKWKNRNIVKFYNTRLYMGSPLPDMSIIMNLKAGRKINLKTKTVIKSPEELEKLQHRLKKIILQYADYVYWN